MSTQLALAKQGSDALLSQEWTEARFALVARTIAKGATPDELALFAGICQRTGLDPFKKQIYAIKRRDGDGVNVMQAQVSIDGLRLIAQRSGEYLGQVGPWWCGPEGEWVDVWLKDTPPAAAKVGVLRVGYTDPVFAVALYREYVQRKSGGEPNYMWKNMAVNQLAKCAEALALRKVFPDDAGGLYTDAEMGQASTGEHLEGVVDVRGMVRGAWGMLREKLGTAEADAWVAAYVEATWPGRTQKDLTDDEAGVLLEALEEEYAREEVVDESDSGTGEPSDAADGAANPGEAESAPDPQGASNPSAEDPVTGGPVSQHSVTGSKGDKYTISVYEDGTWDCTCPARTADCRHAKSIRKPFPGGSGWLWPGDEGYDEAPASAVPGGAPETPHAEEETTDGAPSPGADVFGGLIAFGEGLGLTMDAAVHVIAECGFGSEALADTTKRKIVESALRSAAKPVTS